MGINGTKTSYIYAVCLTFAFLCPGISNAGAHEGEPGSGLEEKLGAMVPQDIVLVDESGSPVRLGELLDRPAILSLVYYKCPNVCPRLISGVGDVIKRLDLDARKDYVALTVSFDETDTPELALEKKKAYFNIVGEDFPESGWRFLTGDRENIMRLTDAVGFGFTRKGDHFVHPITLVALSKEGKIIRYLPGDRFLPFDVKMALIEASEGRVGSTAARVLLYCFSYDPEGKTYAFNIIRIYAAVMLVSVIVFAIFLFRKGRRSHDGGDVND